MDCFGSDFLAASWSCVCTSAYRRCGRAGSVGVGFAVCGLICEVGGELNFYGREVGEVMDEINGKYTQ